MGDYMHVKNDGGWLVSETVFYPEALTAYPVQPAYPGWHIELPGPVYQRMKDRAAILNGQAVLVVSACAGVVGRLRRDYHFLASGIDEAPPRPGEGLWSCDWQQLPKLEQSFDTILAVGLDNTGYDLTIVGWSLLRLRRVGRLVAVVSQQAYDSYAGSLVRRHIDRVAEVNRPLDRGEYFNFDTRLLVINRGSSRWVEMEEL